jgi:hypothetical protein
MLRQLFHNGANGACPITTASMARAVLARRQRRGHIAIVSQTGDVMNLLGLWSKLPKLVQRDIELLTDRPFPVCLLSDIERVISEMEEVPAAYATALLALKRERRLALKRERRRMTS